MSFSRKFERLVRYVSRPPVATARLALTGSGHVRYTLKTPYRDGKRHRGRYGTVRCKIIEVLPKNMYCTNSLIILNFFVRSFTELILCCTHLYFVEP